MKFKAIFRVFIALFYNLYLKTIYGSKYKCTLLNSYSINTTISIQKGGKLNIGKHLYSLARLELAARKNATLIIGDNVFFNNDCTVVSRELITIGNQCLFGPGCKIFDHDHDYKQINKDRKKHFITGKITIGNGVWLGANCIVLRNTTIGDNCVFGAGSIIKGNYLPNTVVVQKREEFIKSIE